MFREEEQILPENICLPNIFLLYLFSVLPVDKVSSGHFGVNVKGGIDRSFHINNNSLHFCQIR